MKKDLKTTIAGVVAAALVVLGIFFPDKIDPDTQLVVNTAAAEIIAGIGALIAVIAGFLAKDPV